MTDGQMDSQTESLWLLQRSALRAMRTPCKNHCDGAPREYTGISGNNTMRAL